MLNLCISTSFTPIVYNLNKTFVQCAHFYVCMVHTTCVPRQTCGGMKTHWSGSLLLPCVTLDQIPVNRLVNGYLYPLRRLAGSIFPTFLVIVQTRAHAAQARLDVAELRLALLTPASIS